MSHLSVNRNNLFTQFKFARLIADILAMKYMVMILIGFLVGCATEAKFTQNMNTWMGRDVNELIAKYGPPGRVYEMPNGNEIYQYHFSNGTRAGIVYGVAYANEVYCNVNFTASKTLHNILSWQAAGNACRAE